jgi:hypothetical protein
MYENLLYEDFGDFVLKADPSKIKKQPIVILAHEFFDALPVNIF